MSDWLAKGDESCRVGHGARKVAEGIELGNAVLLF